MSTIEEIILNLNVREEGRGRELFLPALERGYYITLHYIALNVSFGFLFLKHRSSELMLSISRNVCPCVFLFVRLFTFEVPFKRLFAPTSQSRLSKVFMFFFNNCNIFSWPLYSLYILPTKIGLNALHENV